jgi:hypothetical protein
MSSAMLLRGQWLHAGATRGAGCGRGGRGGDGGGGGGGGCRKLQPSPVVRRRHPSVVCCTAAEDSSSDASASVPASCGTVGGVTRRAALAGVPAAAAAVLFAGAGAGVTASPPALATDQSAPPNFVRDPAFYSEWQYAQPSDIIPYVRSAAAEVGSAIQCPPRHEAHVESSLLELTGIL